ncbi:MAG TPA: molybdenum ABC transporter ATP-binding protein [Xanthobacteraceae bacterium]|nr:molybdenum ABC transporter ATP-binding protein [Xanthobacteraceae bacterium]
MNRSEPTITAQYAGVLGRFKLDVAFASPMQGITGLFGPSGCGKTTILRCVAGLIRLPGKLVVGGEVWQDHATGQFREPYRRPIGYVFQEASLFPHLSVRGNLLYGHRRALETGAAEDIRLADVVDLLGIGPLLDRATGALSGGERQRVALGRALLAQPRLLLMDEPLSALDRMTKEEILPYFELIHASLSIPVLYVSHDISEIERLVDYMVLLEAGRVVSAGPLGDLLSDSRLPIARSPGASTVLQGRVAAFDPNDDLTALGIDGETLLVPNRVGEAGTTRRIRIAATDVSLAVDRPSLTTILNILPVRIADVHPLDHGQINVLVTIGHREGGPRLLARVTRRAQRVLNLGRGQDVYAQIKAVSVIARSRSPT